MRILIILTCLVPALSSAMAPYQPKRDVQFIDEISNITAWYDVTQGRNAAAAQPARGWRFIDDTKSMTQHYADASVSDDESVNVKKRKRYFDEFNDNTTATFPAAGQSSQSPFSYDDIDPRYIKTSGKKKKTFVFDENQEVRKVNKLYDEIAEHNSSDIYCECDTRVRLNGSTLLMHYNSQKHQQFLTASILARKKTTSLDEYREQINQNLKQKKKDLYYHCACNATVHITRRTTLRNHFKTPEHINPVEKARAFFKSKKK